MEQRIRQDLGIGANLRKLRKKHKYTQPIITAKLQLYGIEISRGLYSRIETGELNIRASILVALKDIYKCDYADFFAGLKEELERKFDEDG